MLYTQVTYWLYVGSM